MECVQFLARQNIPFQGSHDGNGNFNQLLLFHLKESKQKKRLLLPKKYQWKKYMHADYQNEILNLMANQVLRNVIGKVRSSPFYALMADEY